MDNPQYPRPGGWAAFSFVLVKLTICGAVAFGGLSVLISPLMLLNRPVESAAPLEFLQPVIAIVLLIAGAGSVIAGAIWLLEEGRASRVVSSRRRVAAIVLIIVYPSLFFAWAFSSMLMFE